MRYEIWVDGKLKSECQRLTTAIVRLMKYTKEGQEDKAFITDTQTWNSIPYREYIPF